MTEAVEQTQAPSSAFAETDLLAAVHQVLERSEEPLTLRAGNSVFVEA